MGTIQWPGETQVFSRDECFVCGVSLDDENRSDEHVFGKWLLGMFDLWNERLGLLNGSLITYKSITIPCCRPCNTGPLSELEGRVSEAVSGGVAAVRALPPDVLFLWLAKLSYGILHLEHFLSVDQARADPNPIVSRELLEQYRVHHYLLRGILGRVRWEQFPGSIAVLPTKTTGDAPGLNFDFNDGPFGPFIAIRLGEVGILGVLQDWGAMTSHPPLSLDRAARLTALAPLQFTELAALLRYVATLFNRTPKLLVEQQGETSVVRCLPLGGLSGRALYDDFDGDQYASLLAHTLGVDLDVVRPEPGKHVTWLVDGDEPIDIPFNAWPVER